MLYGSAVLIYLAFILGLLLSSLPWGGAGLILLGIIIAIVRWNSSNETLLRGPQPFFWLIWGLIGCLASFYLHWRMPQPAINEVSQIIQQLNSGAPSTVEYRLTGQVETLPRLTRSDRLQTWVQAEQLTLPQATPITKNASGRVYVTYPTSDKLQLTPGQQIELSGQVYQPRGSTNPGGFDFADWLRRQQSFSGFKATEIQILQQSQGFGFWKIKQRITQAQQAWLKAPTGPLIGAMVLGSRAVDLPFATQDAFIQVGLAHALAASGFQISLILACIVGALRPFSTAVKFGVGSASLLIFLGLSGVEASVFRAVLMGFAGLVALILGQKMKPIPILILVAFIMLIIQPLWVWDLGFQLSFLATLGLIVTAPPIQQRLEWLPTSIAALIAVPLAATVWTLPLQLYNFGVLPTYSVIANIAVTPLLSIVTLGGFISGIVGFILPPLGSLIAYIVGFPAQLLIWIVLQFDQLPGRSWAVGSISAWQVILVYGIIFGIWLLPKVRQRWFMLLGCTLLALFVPIWSAQGQLSELTLFDAGSLPIMVMRQPHSTVLINSGSQQTFQRTVLPFLQHQGINQVELAIATELSPHSQAGWELLQKNLRLATFSPVSEKNPEQLQKRMLSKFRKMRWQPLLPNQTTRVESASIRVLRNNPALLEFQFQSLTGLMMTNANESGLANWLQSENIPEVEMLWITNSRWRSDIINTINPKVVILSNPKAQETEIKALEKTGRQIFWTARDGAIQWEASHGFRSALSPGDERSPLL